jgi:membrane protein
MGGVRRQDRVKGSPEVNREQPKVAPGDSSGPKRIRLRRVGGFVRLIGLAAWRGLVGIVNSTDPTHAAAIAFYSLLSLFPFLLLALSVVSAAVADEEARARVLAFVLQYFPAQFEFIHQQLDLFVAGRLRIGVGGAVALVWASLGVFGAVSTAVNAAWGVERQRSFLRHKLFSFFMLLAAGGMLLLSVMIVSAAQIVDTTWFLAIDLESPLVGMLTGLGSQAAATLLMVLVCGMIFYFVPNARVRFLDVWPGAVVTALLWHGAFLGFSWVVQDMSRFTVHGSIAAVVVFLLWIYVSALILLYGVELTAAYARLRRRRPDELPATPAPRT